MTSSSDALGESGASFKAFPEAVHQTLPGAVPAASQSIERLTVATDAGPALLGSPPASPAPTALPEPYQTLMDQIHAATPASVAPNPATGPTSVCSVLGADDGGESNLVYT